MRILGRKRVVALVLVAACYGSTIPVFASTDDTGKSDPTDKGVVAKVDAPAPLTERERWLLDRVEELEKRVADLESKGNNPTTSPATDASAAQPPSGNGATSVVAAGTPSIPPAATPTKSDSLPDRAAALGPQAAEKGKSEAAKPGKAEHFAFAD